MAEFFAAKYADANDVVRKVISPDAAAKLTAYPWPCNVRELENTMHRSVLLAAGDEIDAAAILLTSQDSTGGASAGKTHDDAGQHLVGLTVAEVERELIIDTLQHCLGNRTHAATILGISIRTLRNKLKQYGGEGFNIPSPGYGPQAGA